MDFLFPFASFALAVIGTYRSLGLGFAAVCATGYVNGVIRANYLGVFTTFMFDFAVLGLYLGFLCRPETDLNWLLSRPSGRWTLALIAWPMALTALPVNDYLVQLVALRATVWFLPALLIAGRLSAADLVVLSRAIAVLNLCALAGGVYVFWHGVESLYPQNTVTEIIYKSRDVGEGYHRIPSTFLNAHSYGGAMLCSLTLLLDRVFSPKAIFVDRSLAIVGVVAALLGILMCAARQPIVMLAVATVIVWICTRFSLVVGMGAVTLFTALLITAQTSDRFQRAATLENAEGVSGRIHVSANEHFLEIMFQYPLGAGMGSSVGTSVPYFLASRAPRSIGMENEYCRILVDQGWPGLMIWAGFLLWLFQKPPAMNLGSVWGIGVMNSYALCLTCWLTAFIGTGMLASIPGAFLLLTHMGILVRMRELQPRRGSNKTSSPDVDSRLPAPTESRPQR